MLNWIGQERFVVQQKSTIYYADKIYFNTAIKRVYFLSALNRKFFKQWKDAQQ